MLLIIVKILLKNAKEISLKKQKLNNKLKFINEQIL